MRDVVMSANDSHKMNEYNPLHAESLMRIVFVHDDQILSRFQFGPLGWSNAPRKRESPTSQVTAAKDEISFLQVIF